MFSCNCEKPKKVPHEEKSVPFWSAITKENDDWSAGYCYDSQIKNEMKWNEMKWKVQWFKVRSKTDLEPA